jgi:hypothetical protein
MQLTDTCPDPGGLLIFPENTTINLKKENTPDIHKIQFAKLTITNI